MESYPELANSRPLTYVNAINNLLNMTQVLKRKEETKTYLTLLEKRLKNNKNHFSDRYQLRSFVAYYHHLLSFSLENGEPQKALPLLPKIKSGLQQFSRLLNPMDEAMMCYNVFLISFWSKEYATARRWLKPIIEKKSEEIRPDIKYFANLLDIIACYEYNPKDALTLVEEKYLFFNLKEPQNQFEKLVNKNLSSISASNGTLEKQAFFQKLKEDLIKITLDPFEKKAFAYFDFNRWVNEQLTSEI